MLQLNKYMGVGNMIANPEVKYVPSGSALCNFRVAANRKYKSKSGDEKEEVAFLDCEAWGKTAEFVGQHFSKGKPIFIEGRLKTEQWETKDGDKRSRLVVVVNNVQFADAPRKHTRVEPTNRLQAEPNNDDAGGDLPF